MRLLLVTDHRFVRTADGRTWTSGAFTAELWSRYLAHFEAITVVGRVQSVDGEPGELSLSDAVGVEFELMPNVNGLVQSVRRARVARHLAKLIERADAVVVRLPSELGLLACSAARRASMPLLIEVVGSALVSFRTHGSWVGRAYAPVVHRRMQRAIAQAPFVVYVTRRWLQEEYPSPNARLDDALAGNSVPPRLQAGIADAEIRLPDSGTRTGRARRLNDLRAGRAPRFATIASLATRYKGLQVSIPAFARLRDRGVPFSYHVLGGGRAPPWQRLIDRHGLAGHVNLDGARTPGAAVLGWLDDVDVYVQPSLTEGLPRAILEAMSRGVPCLGSDAGGIPELINPDFIHPAGDTATLASHLERVATDPSLLERLSEQSFSKVADYAPEILAAKRDAMFDALRRSAASRKRLLFVHDHRFYRTADGRVWTRGAMSAEFWAQYRKVFEHITVVGRDGGLVGDQRGLAEADAPGVTFALLPDLNGIAQTLNRRRAQHRMAELIRDSGAVIARLPSELGLLACATCERLGKPLLVEVVGSAIEAFRSHGSAVAKLYAPLVHWRTKRAIGNAPFVVYVTQRWLQERYPSGNPVMQGGDVEGSQARASRLQAGIPDAVISLPTKKVRAARASRMAELIGGRPPVFGTIGTLATRYKGLQVAIPAMSKLRSEGHEFTYRILGPGDPEPWLALIRKYGLSEVVHIDPVRPPGEEVLRWLDAIDVHVQPSLTESLGRGTLEAMSRGAACIGSSAGGLREYLDPSFLHPPGDVAALADDLRRLILDRHLIAKLSDRSFETIHRFAPEATGERRTAMLRVLAAAS